MRNIRTWGLLLTGLCASMGAFGGSPPTVTISPHSSFSRAPVVVSLAASPVEAVVRYTLDGTDPRTNALLYTSPFIVASSCQLRAVAWLDNAAGPETQATYTISTNPPNVVVVITEDLGAGDLHQYGNPVHATPNFDALGRAGVRFTQAYCAGPNNAPNQYSALTGRLLPRAGLPPFLAPGSSGGIASREWTLGEAFVKAGWQTAFIGGWHLGDAPCSLPPAQGFQLFYGVVMPAEGTPLTNLRENNNVVEPVPSPTNLLGQFVARSLRFLEANASNRFLLVLQVPPLPAAGSSLGGEYGNRVEALDAALGDLVGKLDALGIRDRTLVLTASDEGPDLTVPLPHGSPGMFRDGRSTTFEGGLRIPAYASWPGTILPGRVSQAVWWLPDLTPSLCAIAGIPWLQDRPMDGTERAGVLSGAVPRPLGTEALFFHRLTNASPRLAAQRLGKVKYHRSLTRTDPENSFTAANLPMLFDMELDPTERFLGFISSLTNSVPALDSAATAHLASFQPPFPQVPPIATLLTTSNLLPFAGSSSVRLSFTRAADTLDSYFTIESSANLVDWSVYPLPLLPHEVAVVSNTSESVTVTLPALMPGAKWAFYRVIARLP